MPHKPNTATRIAHVYTETGCEIATLCGTKMELDKRVCEFLHGWDIEPGTRIEFDDFKLGG